MSSGARVLALGLCGLLLGGCTNSIYFYETEKISITLEGRPDGTSPVSGNIGVKQRVVAFGPPKSVGESEEGEDAVSLISYFAFDKTDAGTFHDPIVIETALITGDAAVSLSDEERKAAFAAFAAYSTRDFSDLMALAGLAYDLLETRGGFEATDEAGAVRARLNELGRTVPDQAEFQRYSWQPPNIVISALPAVQDSGFARVRRYRGELADSISNLRAALAAIGKSGWQNVQINGTTVTFDPTPLLDSALKEQVALLRRRDAAWSKEPAIRELLELHSRQVSGR
jgi:hypothetical protein